MQQIEESNMIAKDVKRKEFSGNSEKKSKYR